MSSSVMKFLGSVLRPDRSALLARHLRLCSAALPASGVWRSLAPDERRQLFQSVLARGAAPHLAGLSGYDALRGMVPLALPSLDRIGRDELAVWLEAAAMGVEGLSATLCPPPAAPQVERVVVETVGEEIFEGEFDDDETGEGEDQFDDDEDEDDEEDDPPSSRSPGRFLPPGHPMYSFRRDIANDLTAAFAAQGITLPASARQMLQAFSEAMTSNGEQYATLYDPAPQVSYNWVGGTQGVQACPANYAQLAGPQGFLGCVFLPGSNDAGLQAFVQYAQIPAVVAAVNAGDLDALAAGYVRAGQLPTSAALLTAFGVPSQNQALYAQAMFVAAQAIAQDLNEPVYVQTPAALRPRVPTPVTPLPSLPAVPQVSFPPSFPGFPSGPASSGLPPLSSFFPPVLGNGPPSFGTFLPGQPSGFVPLQNRAPAAYVPSANVSSQTAPPKSHAIPWAIAAVAAAGAVYYVAKHSRPAEEHHASPGRHARAA